MSFISNKQERTRFLKFAFVGVTGTIVDFGLMNLLRLVFDIPLIWAQAISFSIAVINNFLWNRFWTYPDSRSKAAHRQLIQFFLINLVGIVIRTPMITWLDKILLKSIDQSSLSLPHRELCHQPKPGPGLLRRCDHALEFLRQPLLDLLRCSRRRRGNWSKKHPIPKIG